MEKINIEHSDKRHVRQEAPSSDNATVKLDYPQT